MTQNRKLHSKLCYRMHFGSILAYQADSPTTIRQRQAPGRERANDVSVRTSVRQRSSRRTQLAATLADISGICTVL